MSPGLRRLRRRALWGALLFAAAAVLDAAYTWAGLDGRIELEGNPVLRKTMAHLGIAGALFVEKALTGLVCFAVAWRGAQAIHLSEPWVWKIPMSPPVRRWMKSGDRSWVALAPLYGVAAAQLLAAAAWAFFRLSF